MIRAIGLASIGLAIAIIAFRCGVQYACYWSDPWDLAVSARLRLANMTGLGP